MHESLFFIDQLASDHHARLIADAAAHRRTRDASSLLGTATGGRLSRWVRRRPRWRRARFVPAHRLAAAD
jgi:hypothetical protein